MNKRLTGRLRFVNRKLTTSKFWVDQNGDHVTTFAQILQQEWEEAVGLPIGENPKTWEDVPVVEEER